MQFSLIHTKFVPFDGGLDLVTPMLSMPPGRCILSQNVYLDSDGGRSTFQGYERYSGLPSPSSARMGILPCVITGTILIGDTVTDDGVASGIVVALPEGQIVMTKMSGTFIVGNIYVSAVNVGTCTGPQQSDSGDKRLDAQYLSLAADNYRADIDFVPGSGGILGIWYYNGVWYAFRNNDAGTHAVMYRDSGAGWILVTTPSLLPDGRFEFCTHNFTASLDTKRMYGVDGVNPGFEFDGTTFTQIATGMATDTPEHIIAHEQKLFYSFLGSVQHSSTGDPHTWTPITGAAELGIGDSITCFLSVPGDEGGGALGIVSRNSVHILYGSGVSDWRLVPYKNECGAVEYSSQTFGHNYMVDDRGIVQLQASQVYGNFSDATIATEIKPWLKGKRSRVTASCVVREKNQYWIFFNDETALCCTIKDAKIVAVFPMKFNHTVTCICSTEDSAGNEVIMFGSDDGYIYEMYKGTSFDGDDIEWFMDCSYAFLDSPTTRKKFRRGTLEICGESYAEFFYSYSLEYNKNTIQHNMLQQKKMNLHMTQWDHFVWDNFYWDKKTLAPVYFKMYGKGTNISLRLRSRSDCFGPLRFSGVLYQYSPIKHARQPINFT